MLHRMFYVLLAWLAAVISLSAAVASENIAVSLKEESVIQLESVLLKDVADVKGPDAKMRDALANLSLGPSPEFGSVRILSRYQIGEWIQAARGSLDGVSIIGAPAVQIRLQGRSVSAGEIEPLIKAYVAGTTGWKKSEIEIRSIGNLKGMELPREAQLRIAANATTPGHRNLLIPLEIVLGGKTVRCLWITAEVGIRASILSATKRISVGDMIHADDFVPKTVEIIDLSANYARNPQDILQKVSRRNFSPGDPLTLEAFTNPFLVKSGDTVRLRLVRNGIALTSLARAEQNGSLGQVIKVRNLDFSTLLKAEVTGKAEARVLP